LGRGMGVVLQFGESPNLSLARNQLQYEKYLFKFYLTINLLTIS
jgi:hypothetical protein